MAKYTKGKLYMMSDLHGGWVEVGKSKNEYDIKLNITADTSEFMKKMKKASEAISNFGNEWEASKHSTTGTWKVGKPVYTETNPTWYGGISESVWEPTSKPVPISTPIVEVEYDESLHTLVMKVSVAVSEHGLDQFNGCTTALGEAIGDRMKKQVVTLLLERNKEKKAKGA